MIFRNTETGVMAARTRTNSNDHAKSGNDYNHRSSIRYNAISRDREREREKIGRLRVLLTLFLL